MSDNPQSKNGAPAKPANYRRLTDDDLFRHSSQYRFWSFTPDQLKQKRIEVNAHAVVSVEEDLRKFIAEHRDNLSDEELRTIEERAVPVNMDEEVKLVNFYAKKCRQLPKD